MKLNQKALILCLMVLAAFALVPFLYAEDDDFISVSPVEQQDNSQALQAGAVEKGDKAAPTAEPVKPAAKPAVVAEEKASGNKIEKILPIDLKDKTEIRILTSSPVKFKATELAPPPNARILVQLNNCEVKGDTKVVDKGNVGKVRTAPHSTTAWVVIDLKGKQKWDIAQDGSTLIVNVPKYGAGTASAGSAGQENPQAGVSSEPRKTGSMIYRIIDVAGKNLEKKTRVIITTDGPVKYRVKKDSQLKTITLNIVDAVSIWQKGPIDLAGGPIDKVALKEDARAKEVDIQVSMNENTPYTVTRDQNQIIIDVDNTSAISKKLKKKLDLYQKISLNIQDATLPSVLRLLSTQTGFEFSVAPSVARAAAITVREEDQTLEKVLKDILTPQGIYYEVGDGIIKVGDISELRAAKSLRGKVTRFYTPRTMEAVNLVSLLNVAIAKDPLLDVAVQMDASKGSNRVMIVGTDGDADRVFNIIAAIDYAEGVPADQLETGGGLYRTKVFKLENIRLQAATSEMGTGAQLESLFLVDLKNTIGMLMTDRSNLSIDARTSSIIVTDTVANLKKIERVIKALDVKVPQVTIEAKLYEIDVAASSDIGVQWNSTNQNKEPSIVGDVLAGAQGAGTSSAGGGLTVGAIMNGFKINATLHALETKNKATLLSAPKVTVETSQPAIISTSRNVYYAVQSVITNQNGPPTIATSYNQINLPIELKVYCKVTTEGYINMFINIRVEKIVPTSRIGGPPDTSVQIAATYVKAKNNETIVIGGLINDQVSETEEKVPLLGDLPLIGGLFRGTTKTNTKVELVVFLTPSIAEED